MNNTFYFLRHGKTKVDKDLPVSKWVLSEIGEDNSRKLAEGSDFDNIDLIFSSTEHKAFQTAEPIADKLNKEIIQLGGIAELNRDEGGHMEVEDYEENVRICLLHLNESVKKWEPAVNALERFTKQIELLDEKYENKNILVVGHAYTINMYFASLLRELENVYERLHTNSFNDWGVTKNRVVLKDISHRV